MDAVLRGLKFGRLPVLGRRLASAAVEPLRAFLLEALAPDQPELPTADLVVPVPLHWRRRLARGYNQAECIARPLAELLGLPFSHGLVRRRATAEQARLGPEERWPNLRNAFQARPLVSGKTVLLVDDVVTTAATLDAAARALRLSGASGVTGLAVARTPGPGDPERPPPRMWF